MKKIYIVTALAITLYSHAEISTVELKNASAAMQPGYERLSPAYGALYWYSPFIRNIYSYGPSSATKNLICELFSILHDGSTFDCTHDYFNVACYLEPKHIGALLKIIEKNENDFAQYNKTISVQNEQIAKLLQQFPKNLELLEPKQKADLGMKINRLKKTHKSQADKLKAQRLNSVKKELELYIEDFFKEQHAHIEELFKKGLKSTIKRYQDQSSNPNIQEKEKIQLAEKIKNLQTKQPPSSGSTLVTVLINSKLEEGDLFPKDTVKNILLAFAWKKAADRNDFIQFYEGYAGQTGLITATIIKSKNWKDAYTQQDYKELGTKNIPDFSIDDFIFVGKGYDIFINLLPPKVPMISNAHFQGHSFPDCGETSLRNFFNLLLYTPEKTFDTSVLKKLNADEKLINFYTEYPDCTNIETDAAHDKWATVVSARDGVAYTSNTYEIDTRPTGQANMQKLIGILIPGANSWENLQELLKDKCDIKFTFEEERIENPYILSFSLKKLDGNTIGKFKWIFTPNHFELSIPSQAGSANEKYRGFLKSHSTEDTYTLLSLFTDRIEDFTLQPDAKSCIPLFFASMKTPEQRIVVLETLNTYKGNETIKREAIKYIFLSLPDDGYFIDKAIQILNLDCAAAQYEFLSKTLDGKAQGYFYYILIKDVIQHGNKHLYTWATDNIKNIKNEWRIVDIFKAFMQKQITNRDELQLLKPFYSQVTEYIKNSKYEWWAVGIIQSLMQKQIILEEELPLIKPFYDWAAENIKNSKNESLAVDIFKAFLQKQIILKEELPLIEPFYAWAQNIEKSKKEQLLVDILKALIQKQITLEEELKQLAPFYDWSNQNIENIKNELTVTGIIQSLMQKQVTIKDELPLIKPFYDWATKNIENIEKSKKEQRLVDILKALIQKQRVKEELPLIKPFYDWATQYIKNIKNEWLIVDIIKALIQKQITNKDDLQLTQPFYDWATKNIGNVKDKELIVDIIKALIQKQITNNDELLILQPFYDWATENIENIENEDKPLFTKQRFLAAAENKEEQLIVDILKALIQKQITNKDELLILQPFYTWATEKIGDIENENSIQDIIKMLIEKQITNKETAQSLKPLYKEMLKTKLEAKSRSELQAKLKEIDAITKTVQ